MDQELSRDKILELLSEMSDLSVKARKTLSEGLDGFHADDDDQVLLTRTELESLMQTQENINIYAFHSSGIRAIGDHSSA